MTTRATQPPEAPQTAPQTVRLTALVDPGGSPSGRRLAWLASGDDDRPIGSAFLRLPTGHGRGHLAELEVNVHPAERRHGAGSALLAAAVAAAEADGRRSVVAEARAGTPGEPFLAARGFREALAFVFARLDLQQADQAALDEIAEIAGAPHPGYRLASWDGLAPEELTATFNASRRAMADMPMGDLDGAVTAWDDERLRKAVRAVERRGEHLHTVVAIDESDGTIAGFTELVVPGDGTGDAQHYGTGVLPEHRGHGLARWMKAECVRLARLRHPALSGLLADTAEGNTHMRAINDSLGYRPTHRVHAYRLDL